MFYCSKAKEKHHRFCEKSLFSIFGIKLGDQDKSWVPHRVCRACAENLRPWTKEKRKSLSFGISMIWREPANQVDDCYFCIVNVAGFSSKTNSKINYPKNPLAMRPVPHSDSIPVPRLNAFTQSFNGTDTCTSEDSFIENDEYHSSSDQKKLAVLIK